VVEFPKIESLSAGRGHIDREFRRLFGMVRPSTASESNGKKFIPCGSKIITRPVETTRYFTDVLTDFVPLVFGREWFAAEVAKQRGNRHPAKELRDRAVEFMNKQPKTQQGIYTADPTGPMFAYYSLAYDLWVVSDSGRLSASLLKRLKHPELYQGARHELFAEATCIRAGYEIEHEDESSRRGSHVEFTATQKVTKQKVSVEAKSKHRRGVLGRAGDPDREGEFDLDIGKLLNSAISKQPPYPLVVFLDLNMPWSAASKLMSDPRKQTYNSLTRTRSLHKGEDKISMLVVTNYPEVHTGDEEPTPPVQLMSVFTNVSNGSDRLQTSLEAIHRAANIRVNIPRDFAQ
jgi:hypothetical protein